MKINSVAELLKNKGVKLETTPSPTTASTTPTPSFQRRRLYQSPNIDEKETYGQSTENLLKLDGKPTVETYGQSTENIRISNSQENLRKQKPTDKPTENGLRTYGKHTEISDLVGFQRQTLLALVQQAKELGSLDDTGNRITPPINGNVFAQENIKRPYKQVKDVIYELKRRGFLMVHKIKNGRGGFVQFLIQKNHYRELLADVSLMKPTENGLKTYGKPTGTPTDKPTETVPVVVVSSKYINTTTTGEPGISETPGLELPTEWLTVDYSDLSEIGFTQTHLIQIIRQGKLQPTEVQDSIHFFAFDLNRNGKGKAINGSPLNFFMGILRKGIPYAPPENFESIADEARRKTLEFKTRKERERLNDDQKFFDLEFSEWRRGLSADKLAALLPDFAKRPGPLQDSALKSHFEMNVWPERAQEVLVLAKLDRAEIRNQIDQALGKVSV